jgi:hypothetical protein
MSTPGQRAFERSIADKSIRGGRSGTPTLTNDKRKRPMVTITLSADAIARLDEIAKARGTSRSGAVEQLIRRARIAERESR